MYFKVFMTPDNPQAPYLSGQEPCLLLCCEAAYTPQGLNESWTAAKSKSAALKTLGLKNNPNAAEED